VAVGPRAGMVFGGVIVGFGGALDDAVDFVEIWEGEDEGDVEDFGAVEVNVNLVVYLESWVALWCCFTLGRSPRWRR